ncbi:hypothetical protein GGR55DRAFT_279905 [Xylaria sp. FL0064]|nr:hypothetical protein GGR55DRAFT_279905 [Xylaria sp. FL0064]
MKAIYAFSRFFPFFDHNKPHETSRSPTGFDSMATSGSTASSRTTYLDQQPQVVQGSWIDGNKLKEMLGRKFGSAYRVDVRSDKYRIYANGRLSDAEIASCMYKNG